MTDKAPICPGCGHASMAGIAGGPGDPPLMPLFVCYDCGKAIVVGPELIAAWFVSWSRGRIKADGEWHDFAELGLPGTQNTSGQLPEHKER